MDRRLALVCWCSLVGLPWPSAVRTATRSRLSLDEALRMALENNLDLVSAQMRPGDQREQKSMPAGRPSIPSSQPVATHRPGCDRRSTRSTRTQPSSARRRSETDQPTVGTLPRSSSCSASAATTRSVSTSTTRLQRTRLQRGTNFLADSRTPAAPIGSSMNFNMPLLKGFGKEVRPGAARSGPGQPGDQPRGPAHAGIETTIETVEDAYWDVVAARARPCASPGCPRTGGGSAGAEPEEGRGRARWRRSRSPRPRPVWRRRKRA